MRYFSFHTFFILFFGGLLLSGCSGRTSPAPVTLLNSQPKEKSFGYTDDTYIVKKGDTLFAVAWYTGNDYRDIARYNDLSAPYAIYPGQELRVNAQQKVAKTHPAAPPSTSKKPAKKIKKYNKRLVDRPSGRGYGEGENNVNNQEVASVKPLTQKDKKLTRKSFPDTIKKWVWPAKGKLTGTFSPEESGSKGIEISAPRGTSIRAAAAGKVVYAGNALRGYGNLIIIKHSETFLSAYAYNDTLAVKEQQWVEVGQHIATMGNSGTDSVKLHFEVRYRGKSLDPLRYLPRK